MALFELARGLAAGYNGFNEGVDAEKSRQQADADRKYQAEQRAYQQSQQQRTIDDQRRADEARTALQSIDITQPQPQVLRNVASIQAKAGNIVEALKTQEAATASAYKQSAERFAQIRAAAPSMTTEQLAKAAADAFNSDYLPSKLNGYQVNPDGSIDIDVASPDGRSLKHRFKDKSELLTGMEAQYSPDTYNALIKAQREAAIKAQEKLNENPYLNVPAGGMTIDRRTGKVVANNTTGFVPSGQVDADGNPVMVRPTGGTRGSSAGAGTGGGKTAAGGINEAAKILEDQFGKADGTPEMAQRNTRAMAMLEGVYKADPTISPRTAAYIAADATADPTKLTMQINQRTGEVGLVYRNPEIERGRPFPIAEGSGRIADFEKKVGRPAVQKEVATMVDGMLAAIPEQSREAARQQLITVATNKEQRSAYLQAAQQAGKDVPAIERQLDLVAEYMKPASKDAKAGGGVLDRLRTGGLFGGDESSGRKSPVRAGMTTREMDEAIAKDAREFRAEQAAKKPAVSKEVRDQALNEIAKLQAEVSSLLRSGKPVDANARIEKIKQIKASAGI